MWVDGPQAAYVFPNDQGITVVAWIGPKEDLDACRDQPLEALKTHLRSLPDAPQLHQAELAGEVLMVKDYPNLWRPAVVRGMPLVGDAMMSVDYLWGVGCGWAFQTAEWLCDAIASDLKKGAELTRALGRYERRCSQLAGHRFAINDFARRRSFNLIERLMFSAAAKDVGMARHVNRFGARIDGPPRFLAPTAIMKALWVNLSRRTSPEGTRAQGTMQAAVRGVVQTTR